MTAALVPTSVSSAVAAPQAVTFTVGDLRLAMEVGNVREIVRGVSPVRVPHSPADVAGIIDWRGKLIPMIDLRARFGLSAPGATEHARVIVVEAGGRVLGLAVDKVHTIVKFNRSDLCPPGDSGGCAAMLRGLPDVRAIEGTDLILIDPAMFAADRAAN